MFFPFAGPEGSATVDIWALLQSRPRPLWPESRIDVYVVGSAVVGVKLRGGTVLEVKLRTARDESGVEQWDKVGVAMVCGVDVAMGLCGCGSEIRWAWQRDLVGVGNGIRGVWQWDKVGVATG